MYLHIDLTPNIINDTLPNISDKYDDEIHPTHLYYVNF